MDHPTIPLIPQQRRPTGRRSAQPGATPVPAGVGVGDPRVSAAPIGEPPAWLLRFRRRVIATDAVVVIIAVITAHLVQGVDGFATGAAPEVGWTAWLFSLILIVVWLSALALEGVWESAVLGAGLTEYRRLLLATAGVFALVGIVGYLTDIDIARDYLLVALPVGAVGLTAAHWGWRRRLVSQRQSGLHLRSVMVVGDRVAAGALCANLRDHPDAGYQVTSVCLLRDRLYRADRPDQVEGYPVIGNRLDVAAAAVQSGASAVAVADFGPDGPERLPALTSSLAGNGIRLLVAPDMLDFAGPRTHMRPVEGLALLRITQPRFEGARAVGKTSFDLLGALLGVVVLSPVMLLAALAVLLSDGGPILHRTSYVGRGGTVFNGWSFRCSPQGVKARPVLRTAADQTSTYAMPITPVGRLLIRTGLDESLRLFNVLALQMSLVGPRPVQDGEIGSRNPQVRPGITGPWRISPDPVHGATLRDTAYIDNWSVVEDVSIIGKSLRLVVAGRRPG